MEKRFEHMTESPERSTCSASYWEQQFQHSGYGLLASWRDCRSSAQWLDSALSILCSTRWCPTLNLSKAAAGS